MDETAWIIAGVGIGIGIGVGVALLWQQRQVDVDTPLSQSPGIVSHNVVRDDRGRIESVETVSHGISGGVSQPALEKADVA